MDTLETIDTETFNVAKILYDRTIDLGAHPNERALSSNLIMTKTKTHVDFRLNYLTGDTPEHKLCLKTTAQIGVCSLGIFKAIYRERYDITGISDKLRKSRNRDSNQLY